MKVVKLAKVEGCRVVDGSPAEWVDVGTYSSQEFYSADLEDELYWAARLNDRGFVAVQVVLSVRGPEGQDRLVDYCRENDIPLEGFDYSYPTRGTTFFFSGVNPEDPQEPAAQFLAYLFGCPDEVFGDGFHLDLDDRAALTQPRHAAVAV